MANEAVLVFETEYPINFTVADGATIEKGTLLKLSDPMIAAASDGDENIFAGIAATEKIANDGVTKLGVYRRGIFRVYCSGVITAGDSVATKAANIVKDGDATCVGSKTIGIALESQGDVTGQILLELNIGAGANAFA